MLTVTLRSVSPPGEANVTQSLGALGRAYIDFSLAYPALFDLMFRPGELHPEDPELLIAQREAIGVLNSAFTDSDSSPETSHLTLMSWALAHGLAVLTRDGALQAASEVRPRPAPPISLAISLSRSPCS
jgi:hypothetical protein